MMESIPGNGSRTRLVSLPIHGDKEAPGIARHAVLAGLEQSVATETGEDIVLLVSELVTNSVLHANLSADDIVLVEVAIGDDRVAITVTDPGSDTTPRLLPQDSVNPHGLGLVDDISLSWGVRQKPGATQVWCDLARGESRPGSLVQQQAAR
jgi:hypothetical protein